MNWMEITVTSERANEIVVSHDPGENMCSIGQKVFLGQPGSFKYEWAFEWVDLDELTDLIEALERMRDLMLEGSVCLECQAAAEAAAQEQVPA